MEEQPVRWRTGWRVLAFGLVFAALASAVCVFSLQEAAAFRRDHHETSGVVVESSCWVLCKGGPVVRISYRDVDGQTVEGLLQTVDIHYRVGDRLTVVYSDDAGPDGDVVLPGEMSAFVNRAVGWGVAATVGLVLAFGAWAFPANLRRLDRRDAARAAKADLNRSGT